MKHAFQLRVLGYKLLMALLAPGLFLLGYSYGARNAASEAQMREVEIRNGGSWGLVLAALGIYGFAAMSRG